MDRQVRVFIEGRALDLFNDEQIQVTTSVQNISDISKTHTDISQSFTVPGTSNNNQIFEHFYENAVDGTLDYGLRRDGYIEIDLTTFRKGRISLEKSTVINGRVQDYTITFYGELLSLKDKFGDDKLSDLDYSAFNHLYRYSEVLSRITGSIVDEVAYPLITSNRIWQYNGADGSYISPNYLTGTTTNNDIHTGSGGINVLTELFPAFTLNSIMRLIEQKYAITFNSSFFSQEQWRAAHLWFKNRNTPNVTTQSNYVDWDTLIASTIYGVNPAPYVNVSDNSVNFQYLTTPTTGYSVALHQVLIDIISVSNPISTYYLDVYVNDILVNTVSGVNGNIGSLSGFAIMYGAYNVLGLDETIKVQVRADAGINIDMNMKYRIWESSPTLGTLINEVTYACATQVLIANINLSNFAPNMKITDFFSGILREFNMVCVQTDLDTYEVEPLLNWYAGGAIYDITTYTDISTIDIARVPLYKKISFNYQTSESAMNKYYFQQFNKEYGNTDFQYPYDGGEYTINVPFENLMFNKFTDTNLQVGYCLNSSLAPYIPKPIILYRYGTLTLAKHIHYTDGSNNGTSHDYVMFGQDFTDSNLIDYSLNFAPETSTYHLYPIQQSLFASYYFQYLYNLYNVKNRLTTVKTILPISLLTGLRMNDRVIIRDKRYIINDMKSNLTTGDVTFTLLNDFMPVSPEDIIPPLPERD
jgi:hypothetical protein